MTSSARGLRCEALILVVSLCLCQIFTFFVLSERGLRFFAADEAVATLETLADGRDLATNGVLALRPGAGEPTIVSLGPVDFAPDRTYVLTVRAGAGLEFGIQALDRETQKPSWKTHVPRRAEEEVFTMSLGRRPVAHSARFEIWNTKSVDLEIHELRIQELRRGHAWARALIRPLALALLSLFALRQRRAVAAYLAAGGDHDGSRPRGRFVDGLVATLFFLACFQVFIAAPAQQRIDAKYTSAVSHRVLTAGTVTLPADFSAAGTDELPYQLKRVGGRIVHTYPNAPAILNVPFVAVFDALGLAPVGPNGVFLRHREHQILTFAAAFQAAALCALLFLLARIYLAPPWSLALASVFAFGTQIFSTASRSYWSHTWALLLLTGGVFVLLVRRWRHRRWSYVVAATLLAWSFFCRPPMSLSIVALTVFVVLRRREHFLSFAATGAAWAALFVGHSRHTFDSWLHPYFFSAYVETGTLGSQMLRRTYPRAVVDTLFSAERGLFVFVPFVALLLILLAYYWRRLPHRALAIVALAATVAHWQVICTNMYWSGGGFGPRLLTDAVVWLYLLAILVVLAWRQDPGFGRLGRLVVGAAALLLVAASILVNVRGATARGRVAWDGYSIWDWRQPYFLGRVPPAPRPRTLAERVAELAAEPDAGERRRLFEAIVRDESLVARQIDGQRMTARAVTWDHWTYGTSPGLLEVTNPDRRELVPRLALATWAPRDTYPITVTVADGEADRRYTLAARGTLEIELAPVAPASARLYVVRSDKGWSPGGADERELGVKLLATGGGGGG